MKRHWKLITGIVVAVVFALGAVGYVWLNDLADPMPETAASLRSDDLVTVTSDPWLTFTPQDPASTGLVFYPGGRVPPEAYAPALHAIAEAGYTAVTPAVPFGLAVLSPDVATDVIAAHPEIDRWVVGGHSLGGAMAAQYAAGHDAVDGLVLWGAYPPGGVSLADSTIAVTSIYASEDGLSDPAEIDASRSQLPADADFVEIEGGNHAGFGWYGDQAGDGTASISREEQQSQVVAATLELLERVDATAED